MPTFNHESIEEDSLIDFNEIESFPIGNKLTLDRFECFAEDLLYALGFTIISSPGRGADGGKDLIVSEIKQGILSSKTSKILVSCKNFSKSRKSVNCNDEPNIKDRLERHRCDSFLGFYSTIASSDLVSNTDTIKERSNELSINFLSGHQIRKLLCRNNQTLEVFKTYLPSSFRKYSSSNLISNIYPEPPYINCQRCSQNLLDLGDVKKWDQSYVLHHFKYDLSSDREIPYLKGLFFTCANCKDIIKNQLPNEDSAVHRYFFTTYESQLSSYIDPCYFIDRIIETQSRLRNIPDYMNDDLFRLWNRFILIMFYYNSKKIEKRDFGTMERLFKNYSITN